MENFLKTLFTSIFFVAIFLGGYSCSSGDYMDEFEVRRMIEEALKENNKQLEITNWKIVNFEVKKENWTKNGDSNRYESVFELPDLTEFIYESGAVLGYVFFGDQNIDEVQTPLPTSDGTLSFDVQFKKNNIIDPTVAFYNTTSNLADNYNFRIVLVW